MLVSIHMPRTGGTSFTEILRTNFSRILEISEREGIRDFLLMSREQRSSYPAAAGHMPFGLGYYVDVACQYVVFLREPVDHTISAYYYVLRTPSNPQHAAAKRMTLREYVESDLWPINDNQQTRRLADDDWVQVLRHGPNWTNGSRPCDTELLRRAKANLDRCDFVGVYERYEEGVRACCDRFGLTFAAIPSLNAASGRPAVEDVDPEMRAIIRKRRHFDSELYEHAIRRFESLAPSPTRVSSPRPLGVPPPHEHPGRVRRPGSADLAGLRNSMDEAAQLSPGLPVNANSNVRRGSVRAIARRGEAREAMIGVYDFSYAPYALGDALTWTMNLNVGAAEAGLEAVDQYLVIDPPMPSSRYQPFVNSLNYAGIIDGLFPAFLCSPLLRSLKLIRHRPTFNLFLLREVLHRRRMWPSHWSHLNRKLDFVSHHRINAFYRTRGTLPWLTAPRGYGVWAAEFRRRHAVGRFLIAVHVRQGALSVTPANIYRDSPMSEWRAFMALVADTHPEVLFAVLGGYTEWDRTLERLPNVVIPRTLGLGLGHELALLHRADLFMGSSSGFAAMATFCNAPYVITHVEHLFARYIDVPIGARHHIFGNENQILDWQMEARDRLFELFVEVYERLAKRTGA